MLTPEMRLVVRPRLFRRPLVVAQVHRDETYNYDPVTDHHEPQTHKVWRDATPEDIALFAYRPEPRHD